MNTRQQLKKFEKSLDVIRSITRAFERTATQKMSVNRQEIEKIAKHLDEVKQTYVNTKISITKGAEQRQKMLATSVRRVSKQKVVILVTSEPQYYGNLMPAMIREFSKELESGASDAIIIGKPGREEFDKVNRRGFKYVYYDFSDDAPDWQIVGKISKVIKEYAQINIIFCRFQSILAQDVLNQNIAREVLNVKVPEKKKYLIKPEPASVLTFLEKQIITSNLLQKLFENGLAKGAIRIRILEIGEIAEKLTETMEKFEIYKKKVVRNINNRKQTSLYGASSAWQSESIFTIYR